MIDMTVFCQNMSLLFVKKINLSDYWATSVQQNYSIEVKWKGEVLRVVQVMLDQVIIIPR